MKKTFISLFWFFIVLNSFSQDLIITGVNGPTSFERYSKPTYEISIKNQGIVDALGYAFGQIFLSKDKIFDREDISLGLNNVKDPKAGSINSLNIISYNNIRQEPGTYYLIVTIDFANRIKETDETNNIFVSNEITILPADVDLSFSSVTLSKSVAARFDVIDMNIVIVNSGATDLTDSYIYSSTYLSKDNLWDSKDTLLAIKTSKLNDSYSFELYMPDVAVGDYHLITVADFFPYDSTSYTFDEKNETNNIIIKPISIVKDDIDLDLTVNSGWIAMYSQSYDYFYFDLKVRNNGSTRVGAFSATIWISSDQVLDERDYFFGVSGSYKGLDAKATSVFFFSTSQRDLRNFPPPGRYYVIVYLNQEKYFSESSMANNTIVSSNAIEILAPGKPDIVAAAMVQQYNDLDNEIEVDVNVQNTGGVRLADLKSFDITILDEFQRTVVSTSEYEYISLDVNQKTSFRWRIKLQEPLLAGKYNLEISCYDPYGNCGSGFKIPFTIEPTVWNLSGVLTKEDGKRLNNGKLFLYRKEANGVIQFVQKIDPVTDSLFTFKVDRRPYTLYYIPNLVQNPDLVPTILRKTVVLTDNSFLSLTNNRFVQFEILGLKPIGIGGRKVSGTITSESTGGRTEGSGKIFTVILLKEDGTPVKVTQTSEDGSYEFSNLPDGSYKVVVSFQLDEVKDNKPIVADVAKHDAKVDLNVSSQKIEIKSEVVRWDQVLQFTSIAKKVYGDLPFLPSASVNTGLPITYFSSNLAVAEITVDNKVKIVGAGQTTITAKQMGNEDYLPIELTQELIVDKASQLIQFNTLMPKNSLDGSFELIASASSSLPVAFSSSDPTVVSIAANLATIHKAGTTKISAQQAGNGNYLAAEVVQDFIVSEVTGVEDVHTEFNLYPNPATKEVSIIAPISFSSIVLIDTNGRVIVVPVLDSTIDVRGLNAGVYLIRFTDSITKKLVVMN